MRAHTPAPRWEYVRNSDLSYFAISFAFARTSSKPPT
jgi:hypothetical protein